MGPFLAGGNRLQSVGVYIFADSAKVVPILLSLDIILFYGFFPIGWSRSRLIRCVSGFARIIRH